MNITRNPFGTTDDGNKVDIITLENSNGISASIITWGATLQSLKVPDRNGVSEEICLGFDNLEGYTAKNPYFGCTVGRFANRIAGGKFTIDGVEYQVDRNEDGFNHLHGGSKGFYKVIWEAFPVKNKNSVSVKMVYSSKDGEMGYPGNLDISATFILNEKNDLEMIWEAVCDKATPVNITNHAYFNLSGKKSKVLDHLLMVNADYYLPVDKKSIPTGKLEKTSGTPMDFTALTPIGKNLKKAKGYDHCYAVNGKTGELRKAAELVHEESGRKMELYTTQPGVQIYSGIYLKGSKSRLGKHKKYEAVCLETEHYPDSPNHPDFPDCIIRPGETYSHKAVYKFIKQ